MKPFDLDKALAGEPVVTRGGREASEIFYARTANEDERVIAIISGRPLSFCVSGELIKGEKNIGDLFMAPKKRTVWVNFYPDGIVYWHESEKLADKNAGKRRIGGKAYPVEIEE